jgi:hypothetical protein
MSEVSFMLSLSLRIANKQVLALFGLVSIGFVLNPASWAQGYLTQTGNTPFSTEIPVELGYYDPSTGDLHLAIMLGTWPQRGAPPLTASLVYDSRIWYINGNAWNPNNIPNSTGGWRLQISPIFGGSVSHNTNAISCNIEGAPRLFYYAYNDFWWTDPYGTVHTFPINTEWDIHGCGNGNVPSDTEYAIDSTGYQMAVTNYTNVSSITAPDGSQVYPTYKDRNGNYFSTDSNVY